MKYTIAMVLRETKGTDGQVTMRLLADLPVSPKYLSNFESGTGEIEDGYSTQSYKFSYKFDSDHEHIIASYSDGRNDKIFPPRERNSSKKGISDTVKETVLSIGSIILYSKSGNEIRQEYEVTYASWL